MFKTRCATCIIILMLSISFTGCAGLQRKFTRKKEKEEKVVPIITTYDYSKELRLDELYKKRFLFWKTWQLELIDRLDSTYKKRIVCYDHVVENLLEMKKYLTSSKVVQLEGFIKEVTSINPDIKKKRLLKSERYRMRLVLEKTKRQIDREFSYSKVKDFLELKK